ncbi:hypothetical protein [Streptomyces sp. XD-27]|uniref:hypothetical protein n=1 Tax=Streptomyces sp. XD-27 TaxID=3062779 RepID=UPI0026F44430|nr:hypothetical protein [Streptomyces sp. XD-27]WKX74064.1 hypothetical protein Q3Y56_33130 [Streptomyces sp. XD-27]
MTTGTPSSSSSASAPTTTVVCFHTALTDVSLSCVPVLKDFLPAAADLAVRALGGYYATAAVSATELDGLRQLAGDAAAAALPTGGTGAAAGVGLLVQLELPGGKALTVTTNGGAPATGGGTPAGESTAR